MKNNYNLKTRVSLIVACLLVNISTFAQLAMTRSTFTAPFVPITTGGGALTSTATGDDNVETGLPIGFTFNYLGTPFTSIGANTNGAAGFVAMTSTRFNTDLSTATAPNSLLAAWWDDLSSSAILYQTRGTAGSQTFTLQWASLSYYTGSTQNINFQIVLHEGTNVIEFNYGTVTAGTFNTAESATIGIKGATGGVGIFIDGVTGSSFVSSGYPIANTTWPVRNIRFTPGAPTVLPGGTYTVGATGTYPTLDEAVADLNHRGISGPVILSLLDAMYNTTPAGGDNIFPVLVGPITGLSAANTLTIQPASGTATLSYDGSAGGFCSNATTTSAMSTANEPIIGLVGANYVTLNNLNLTCSSTGVVDRGISLINYSATVGSQFNTIQNVSVSLNRGNISSVGMDQRVPTTPTSAAGANSNNIYKDFSIKNVYAGLNLLGNANFPDLNSQVITSSCLTFNTIGDSATANDIGNGTSATYGISATNQSGFTISNNSIRNVTNTNAQADGISIVLFKGTCSLYNNKIQGIRNAGLGSTTGIDGIRMTHTTTGTHTIRVYNNAVSEITSGYTGATSAARTLKGIFVNGAGGATTQTYEIYNNNISIDGSASPNLSSTCFEINATAGPLYQLGNNIFANYTTAQGAPAKHFAIVSSSATVFGPAGSTSDNNDFYIANDVDTSGFVGGAAVNYTTIATWAAAMSPAGMEAASVSVNPMYINITNDLHANAAAVDGAGQTPPSYITSDLDCASRTLDNDIGAYIVCPAPATPGVISGLGTICAGTINTYSVTAVAGATSYTWTLPGAWTGISVTDSITTTANTTSGDITVTATNICGTSSASTQTIIVNPLPIVIANTTAGIVCAGTSVTLTGSGTATSYVWTGGVTDGIAFIPDSTDTYIVTGIDTNSCSNTDTVSVTVNALPTVTANTTASIVCAGTSVTLTGSGTATSYAWSGGVADGVAFVPDSTGTYTVTGTDVNSCSDTATISVIVNSLPTVNANASVTTVCAGTSVTLTGSGTATSYAWSGGVTNGIGFVPDSTNTYTVTGADANGCSDTATISVIINSLPTVTANATATTVCAGTSITLTGSGTATSYAWTGSVIDGIGFVPTSTDTYTVTGTDTNSCSNTDTVSVTVNPLPTVTANATAIAVCAGTSVTLTGSGTATSYAWTGGVTDGVGFVPTSTDTYTVTGTDTKSCSNTDMISVTVNPLPTINANTTAITVCAGTSVTLTGSGTGTSFAWSGGVTDGIGFVPDSTNTYTVTGTDANGCSDTATISVNVNSLPVVVYNEIQTLVCLNSSTITLTAGTPSSGIYSGTAVTGNTFAPATAGTGTFTIVYTFTDISSCTNRDSSAIVVDLCTGISEISNSTSQILIYPNPNSGTFSVQSSVEGVYSIQNELGQTIQSVKLNATNNYTSNIENLSNGIYFVVGFNSGSVSRQKIVVTK